MGTKKGQNTEFKKEYFQTGLTTGSAESARNWLRSNGSQTKSDRRNVARASKKKRK